MKNHKRMVLLWAVTPNGKLPPQAISGRIKPTVLLVTKWGWPELPSLKNSLLFRTMGYAEEANQGKLKWVHNNSCPHIAGLLISSPRSACSIPLKEANIPEQDRDGPDLPRQHHILRPSTVGRAPQGPSSKASTHTHLLALLALLCSCRESNRWGKKKQMESSRAPKAGI